MRASRSVARMAGEFRTPQNAAPSDTLCCGPPVPVERDDVLINRESFGPIARLERHLPGSPADLRISGMRKRLKYFLSKPASEDSARAPRRSAPGAASTGSGRCSSGPAAQRVAGIDDECSGEDRRR